MEAVRTIPDYLAETFKGRSQFKKITNQTTMFSKDMDWRVGPTVKSI